MASWIDDLIDLWRSHECLYDNSSPDYRDKYMRNLALEDMQRRLNMPDLTITQIGLKMKNLRTQFMRQMNIEIRKGGPPPEHRKWQYMNALEFLRPFYSPKSSTQARGQYEDSDGGDLTDVDEDVENDAAPSDVHSPLCTSSSPSEMGGKSAPPAPVVTKRPAATRVDTLKRILPNWQREPEITVDKKPRVESTSATFARTNSNSDDLEVFGRFVVSEMRFIDNPRALRQAKMQITNIIFQCQEQSPAVQGFEMLQAPVVRETPVNQLPAEYVLSTNVLNQPVQAQVIKTEIPP